MNDLIYRQAAIEAVGEVHPLDYNAQSTVNRIKKLPSAQEWISFTHWVAKEVIDDENWDLNCISFPEVACRKLNKLGIIDTDGRRWIYTPPKEEEGE